MLLSPLRRKLLWLLAGRAAVVTLLLGSGTLLRIASPDTFRIDTDAFFALIGVTYGLTIGYAVALKYIEKHRWLIDVQLAIDAVVVSIIVHLTGGVTSYFSSLYTLPIIAATIIESRRGGLMVGILSCVLYGGLVLGQYLGGPGFPPRPAEELPAARMALYTVGLNLFGFAAIAALSGYLAEGLRQADIQLQRASNQIEDLQAFSQHVIDSLMSGLATTDIEGRVLTVNRAATTITGIPASEAVGASAVEVFNLPPEFQSLFGSTSDRLQLPRVEFTFTRRDGRQIDLGFSTALLQTPRGDGGFLLTFRDVTEVRRQERDARIQQHLAAVGEMAAGIAHEIRNPLASMAGSIQMLRHELPLTPDQSQLMDIVLRESERLNNTIRSFLAYARPQRETMARIDITRILTETATLLEHSSELSPAHRIAVDTPGAAVWLQADEGQVRQIVWNLATNGLRAMASGGCLTLGVRTARHQPPGDVVIEIRDQGVGIPPEELDGMFQPFRSGFSRGTGLGLSIVQRIVAEYGGEIQVTSREGQGTSVLVRLPEVARAAGAAVQAEKVG